MNDASESLSFEAIGELIAGAPDAPAAVVLNVGVGSDQRISVTSSEVFGVAAFDEAADDFGAVEIGAGFHGCKDADDDLLSARTVEIHLFRCGGSDCLR
ncbi:hypothetical protein [Synechococcus phage S-H1]|nr:hypothetical protein [Synechococcus phage S-H1]